MSYNPFYNQLNNSYRQQYQYINQQHNYLLELLNSSPAIRQPVVLSKEARLKQIDNELDIIRGIIPTPKGYIVDKSKIKNLLKERKSLY